ncbi:MAG TPA: hypothetical protein VNZ52_10470 [Candidatus Thermoplasmatota archaeon]|nr:hypothetical protein [Candidatus Thermoplasmatota archaeon]
MTDTDPQKAEEGTVANAQAGGRYGKADPEKPHLSPEVPPVGGANPNELSTPMTVSGALPENRGDDPADLDRERGKPGPGQAANRPPESRE